MWSEREQAFFWFDVPSRQLFRQGPADRAASRTPLPRMPGSFGWRRDGGMVMAFRNAIALSPSTDGPFDEIECGVVDFATERFNDGAVDCRGRFWVGSFHPRVQPGGGCLYRLDPDLTLHRMARGMTMSNGMGWNSDNSIFYAADSRPGGVWAFDFDPAGGTLDNKRRFIDYAGRPGRPDGLTVDEEDHIWIAEVGAGRIARYDPDGMLVDAVPLSVSKPTSLTFGGPDYRSLLVTTMTLDLEDQERAAQPDAGRTFLVRPGARGRPEAMFAG